MLKKRNWLVLGAFLLNFLFVFKNSVLAADAWIENPSENFKDSACNTKFACSSTNTTNEGVPNVSASKLCDSGWTPTCNYDWEGNRDLNVWNCSCRKLQAKEPTPTNSANNACTCDSNNKPLINECNNGLVPICNNANNAVPYCLCSTSDVAAVEGASPNTNSNSNVLCDGDKGVNTALGCIPIGSSGFTSWILGWLFGVAGGIAFLLMVYGFILVATSGGDEKKVAGAKETITSAIVGLLVCIFAVFILKLVAVNILNIPGF